MKKGVRAIFIASAILVGTGLVATASGLMMGASFRDANLSRLVTANPNEFGIMTWEDESMEGNGNRSEWQSLISETYTDVKSIDLDAGAGEVVITQGDSFSINVTGKGPKIYSKVVDGHWEIETKYNEKFRVRDIEHFVMNITLPADFVAEEIDMNIGAGSLTADTLRAKKLYMEAGMGKINVDYMEAGESELVAGMGVVVVDKGKLTGDITLDCGMGEIRLEIQGKEADYGGSYDVGMGSARIGGRNGVGMASSSSWEAAAGNYIQVDCGMGQVNVSFAE